MNDVWGYFLYAASVVVASGCLIGIALCLWYGILYVWIRALTLWRAVTHHLSRLQEQKFRDIAERNRMKKERLISERDLLDVKRSVAERKNALRIHDVEADAHFRTVARDAQAQSQGVLQQLLTEQGQMRQAIAKARTDAESVFSSQLETAKGEMQRLQIRCRELEQRPSDESPVGDVLGLVLQRLDDLSRRLATTNAIAPTPAAATPAESAAEPTWPAPIITHDDGDEQETKVPALAMPPERSSTGFGSHRGADRDSVASGY